MHDLIIIIILASLLFIICFWGITAWFYDHQLNKLRRKYKPEDDKTRREGAESGRSNIYTYPREPNFEGIKRDEGRELLPIPISEPVGEDKRESPVAEPEPTKSSGLFGRIRRRKKQAESLGEL